MGGLVLCCGETSKTREEGETYTVTSKSMQLASP